MAFGDSLNLCCIVNNCDKLKEVLCANYCLCGVYEEGGGKGRGGGARNSSPVSLALCYEVFMGVAEALFAARSNLDHNTLVPGGLSWLDFQSGVGHLVFIYRTLNNTVDRVIFICRNFRLLNFR